MTKKVKMFWYVLKNSLIPQKKYYKHISQASFSFSIKYLFILTLILNLFLFTYLGLKYNPNKLKSLFSQISKSLDSYPDDLSIMINKGHLLTTYDRPFFLWLNLKNKVIPLLVIDETARETKINQYKSIFLLTSNYLVYKQPQSSSNLEKVSLKTIPTCFIHKGTINKTTISKLQNILNIGSSYIYFWFILFMVLLIIILPTTFFLFLIIFLFFLSIIFYLISRIFTSKTSFINIFKFSFHSTTLPLLLAYVLNYKTINFSFFSPSILFLTSIFLFGAVYEHYEKSIRLKKHKNPSTHHHSKKNRS